MLLNSISCIDWCRSIQIFAQNLDGAVIREDKDGKPIINHSLMNKYRTIIEKANEAGEDEPAFSPLDCTPGSIGCQVLAVQEAIQNWRYSQKTLENVIKQIDLKQKSFDSMFEIDQSLMDKRREIEQDVAG